MPFSPRLKACHDRMAVSGERADPGLEEGRAFVWQRHGVCLPASYEALMELFGPGTLGGFLHVHPASDLQLHRERLQPFLDEELEALLAETGDVLIFADSDNGDMCGWSLAELKAGSEPPVWWVSDFEMGVLAGSVTDLTERLLAGEDLFGTGALAATYVCSSPR
ncbi:hypothetical protein [Deinococcus altitudinis]|uniref:hypothetical protein n=1 Tax=Deinococcus altitudinis TaxID=468914 RepID=UPI00389282E0